MGGIALKLKYKEGIDYIVSVRNSDVNLFFKYGLWLRKAAIAIMLEASNIVFISPSYKRRVLETYIPNNVRQKIERKSLILPNGINNFWPNNACNITRVVRQGEIRLIYIGELTRNKNVKTCIKVVKKLSDKGYKATLKIIGEGPEEKTLRKMAAGDNKRVFFYGFIDNKKTIAKLMAQSDIFIMPSFTETFGVAYIEAMSQGLPLIYTHNEGIDGFYQDGQIGYAVNPLNVDQIILCIEEIFSDYDNISMRCKIESHNFAWDKIGNDYINNIIKIHQKSICP
jgi:glycosyltransferase involved in cell wall biosynthesis